MYDYQHFKNVTNVKDDGIVLIEEIVIYLLYKAVDKVNDHDNVIIVV